MPFVNRDPGYTCLEWMMMMIMVWGAVSRAWKDVLGCVLWIERGERGLGRKGGVRGGLSARGSVDTFPYSTAVASLSLSRQR